MVTALGAMSGTSLDGVDAAVIETDGESVTRFGASGYRAYTEAERQVLRRALGRWPGEPGVAEAARVVEDAHAALLAGFEAEVVGFHGQTLAHEPQQGRGTHQAGDGAALARRLGRTVVWDFRSSDVAAGGEGAPLAPFFHFACAGWIGAEEPLGFLNLGGVGNLTWLDPAAEGPETPGAILAFDTGPANAPIDDLMQRRRSEPCDRGGALAASGQADAAAVARFLRHAYFERSAPKSLDRGAFPELSASVERMSDADAAATLTEAAAAAVLAGLRFCPSRPARLLVTGGGRRNPTLMARIAAGFDGPVEPVEAVGLDGDMLEAQAFAYLAVRALRGLPLSAPGTTGVRAPQAGGRISEP